MEGRVTRLEVEFEHVRRDLDEIKVDQKTLLQRIADIRIGLAQLPTSARLFGYTATVGALAVAVVAVFIGVLAYTGTIPKP